MKKLTLFALLFASSLSAQVQLGKGVQVGGTSTGGGATPGPQYAVGVYTTPGSSGTQIGPGGMSTDATQQTLFVPSWSYAGQFISTPTNCPPPSIATYIGHSCSFLGLTYSLPNFTGSTPQTQYGAHEYLQVVGPGRNTGNPPGVTNNGGWTTFIGNWTHGAIRRRGITQVNGTDSAGLFFSKVGDIMFDYNYLYYTGGCNDASCESIKVHGLQYTELPTMDFVMPAIVETVSPEGYPAGAHKVTATVTSWSTNNFTLTDGSRITTDPASSGIACSFAGNPANFESTGFIGSFPISGCTAPTIDAYATAATAIGDSASATTSNIPVSYTVGITMGASTPGNFGTPDGANTKKNFVCIIGPQQTDIEVARVTAASTSSITVLARNYHTAPVYFVQGAGCNPLSTVSFDADITVGGSQSTYYALGTLASAPNNLLMTTQIGGSANFNHIIDNDGATPQTNASAFHIVPSWEIVANLQTSLGDPWTVQIEDAGGYPSPSTAMTNPPYENKSSTVFSTLYSTAQFRKTYNKSYYDNADLSGVAFTGAYVDTYRNNQNGANMYTAWGGWASLPAKYRLDGPWGNFVHWQYMPGAAMLQADDWLSTQVYGQVAVTPGGELGFHKSYGSGLPSIWDFTCNQTCGQELDVRVIGLGVKSSAPDSYFGVFDSYPFGDVALGSVATDNFATVQATGTLWTGDFKSVTTTGNHGFQFFDNSASPTVYVYKGSLTYYTGGTGLVLTSDVNPLLIGGAPLSLFGGGSSTASVKAGTAGALTFPIVTTTTDATKAFCPSGPGGAVGLCSLGSGGGGVGGSGTGGSAAGWTGSGSSSTLGNFPMDTTTNPGSITFTLPTVIAPGGSIGVYTDYEPNGVANTVPATGVSLGVAGAVTTPSAVDLWDAPCTGFTYTTNSSGVMQIGCNPNLSDSAGVLTVSETLLANGTGSRAGITMDSNASGISSTAAGLFQFGNGGANDISGTVEAAKFVGNQFDMPAVSGVAGFLVGNEGTTPGGASAVDVMWANSVTHRFSMNNNNTGTVGIVGAANAMTPGDCPQIASNGFDLADSGAICGLIANWSAHIDSGLFSTATMLGPIFSTSFAPMSGSVITARLAGAITCSVAPVVEIMDLGASPTTVYGSATSRGSLTTGTSDGAYSVNLGGTTFAATHYYGFAFSSGTCATAPTFDLNVIIVN